MAARHATAAGTLLPGASRNPHPLAPHIVSQIRFPSLLLRRPALSTGASSVSEAQKRAGAFDVLNQTWGLHLHPKSSPRRATQVSPPCQPRVTCPAGSQRHGKGPGSGSPARSPTFPSQPVSDALRDVHGPRGHRPPCAGPCLPADPPAATLIHYLRNPISRASSSGKLSLIKRVKPRGRGLTGNRLQRAGGSGRGSTSLAPWGRATEGDSRALGHAGDATRWQEPRTGHIPTRER